MLDFTICNSVIHYFKTLLNNKKTYYQGVSSTIADALTTYEESEEYIECNIMLAALNNKLQVTQANTIFT